MRQDPTQLLLEARNRKVREAWDNRPCRIDEVKEGPDGQIGIRVVLGGMNGTPYKSQWIYPSMQHGGDTERHFFKKGQNGVFTWNNGRPQFRPYAPSRKLGVPKHAKDAGLRVGAITRAIAAHIAARRVGAAAIGGAAAGSYYGAYGYSRIIAASGPSFSFV